MIRLLLFEHIQSASESLRRTRTRAILTVLGITIGVASITTILAVSGGLSNIIAKQVDALGGNIAVVRPGSGSSGLLNASLSQQSYATSTLTDKDADTIANLPGVAGAAPIMNLASTIRAKDAKLDSRPVVGTYPSLADIAKIEMCDGQFIDTVTNGSTAVIGPQLSVDLFGTDHSVGKTLTIRGHTYTVIGITKKSSDPINFNDIDFDNSVIISLSSIKSFHQGTTQIQQINVKAKDAATLESLKPRITAVLTDNHLGETDFNIISGKAVTNPNSRLFEAITLVLTVVAGISLVVGGIGIMNIMLVGVAERTREIGLRKSVGASNSNIIGQFMTETLMLSSLGGIFGYVGGYILAYIVCTFLPFDPALSWQIAAMAMGISIVVGVVFGFYPALRASRKDPIESLRQYH